MSHSKSLITVAATLTVFSAAAEVTLLNVSYDPTRPILSQT